MAASAFDSQHLAKLFDTGELAALFTDSAEMRALLLVEGALAKVQGTLDVIPEISGAFLHRAAMEVQVDPSGLTAATAQNGVSIPAFLAALRKTLEAPEHAQYLHWGATSQDILDTALMLRLKRAFDHIQTTLKKHLTNLSDLAEKHSETPMAGRTWGQHATPTSFGAVVAAWGHPLLTLAAEFETTCDTAFWVSLSGAAGTSSALGPKAGETRAALATALGLHDPAHSWHNDRTPIVKLASWATRLTNALGKMAADLSELTMTELAEVTLGGAGSSSTMPQKQNPVSAGVIAALATHVTALNSSLQASAQHAQQRDGGAWITEWLTVPQLVLGTGAALGHAERMSAALTPNTEQMNATLHSSKGLIFAEALSFALANAMPRPEAQLKTKEVCAIVINTEKTLEEAASELFPELDFKDVFDAKAQLGSACEEARAFAVAVRGLA